MSGTPKNFLVVDDDAVFCEVLGRALQRRGFTVRAATTVADAERLVREQAPDHAVVDLRIGNESGLALVRKLAALTPPVGTVVLTGYGSIATAVDAIKLGAAHYLTKPVEVDEILAALQHSPLPRDAAAPPQTKPLSVRRAEWEHIQRVLSEYAGNISAAARALGIHRRTLQRKLRKRPVRG